MSPHGPPDARILELAQQLVRIPSQAGIDPLEPILERLEAWCAAHRLRSTTLRSPEEEPVGLLVRIEAPRPGPHLCLDAPIDTAPAGRDDTWSHPPFEGRIVDGRLYGRGAADCKMGVSVLCHVAEACLDPQVFRSGRLDILLDGDEHTGRFGGVRSYIEGGRNRPDFAAVAYPGNYGVVRGARGFYRAYVRTYGEAGHSGARRSAWPGNAIAKAARLVELLRSAKLPVESDQDFRFGPALSVTGIDGGTSFSQTPGDCRVGLDARLTPHFGTLEAERFIRQIVHQLDLDFPTRRPTDVEPQESWPCYRLPRGNSWVRALQEAASRAFGRRVHSVVCGPSNIGNYLSKHSVPATCGFGVSYENLHGADEYADVATIGPTYQTYLDAVRTWSATRAEKTITPAP